jgi:hypothetical protein
MPGTPALVTACTALRCTASTTGDGWVTEASSRTSGAPMP